MLSLIKKFIPILIIVFSALLSYFILRIVALPFVWLALIWVVAFIILIRIIKYSFLKKLFLSLIVIIFIFGVVEVYYDLTIKHDATLARGDILEDYSIFNEVLGYGPKKDTQIPVAKYYGDELVYKATYTIDKNGLRVGPEYSKNRAEKCVVFFGGSFTFGRGVEDDETLPYLVAKESGGRVHTINLAFSGYGPHQMLAMLENGLEQDVLDCKPDVGIYQGIVHHVARVNGRVDWDVHGPRYVVNDDGEVFQDGHYDDVIKENKNDLTEKIKSRLHSYLSKSRFYIETYKNVLAASNLNNFVELYLGVVEKSRTIFENRYPDSEFYVIFWDDPDYYNKYTKKILDGFQKRGIKVFIVSEMLPGYLEDKTQYELSPYDSHPNPKAYELLSEYTLQNILN